MQPFDFKNRKTWNFAEHKFYYFAMMNMNGKTDEEVKRIEKYKQKAKDGCRVEFLDNLLSIDH